MVCSWFRMRIQHDELSILPLSPQVPPLQTQSCKKKGNRLSRPQNRKFTNSVLIHIFLDGNFNFLHDFLNSVLVYDSVLINDAILLEQANLNFLCPNPKTKNHKPHKQFSRQACLFLSQQAEKIILELRNKVQVRFKILFHSPSQWEPFFLQALHDLDTPPSQLPALYL